MSWRKLNRKVTIEASVAVMKNDGDDEEGLESSFIHHRLLITRRNDDWRTNKAATCSRSAC